MIEYDGVTYKLYFTEGVVEALEAVLGHSLMSSMYTNQMMLPLKDLKYAFVMALAEVDTGKRPGQNYGMKIFEQAKADIGYAGLCEMVAVAFEHDCPFFFQMN